MNQPRRLLVAILGIAMLLPAGIARAAETAAKSTNSAKAFIRNKDYAGAKKILDESLKANPDAPELVLLAATCDENLGNFAPAVTGYKRCLTLLDANSASAPASVRVQALAGIKRLDESEKLAAKYAALLEEEAKRQQSTNDRAAGILSAGAKALRDAAKDSQIGLKRPREEKARSIPKAPTTITIEAMHEFTEKHAQLFPRDLNLSPGGRALGSSTHPEREEATTALGGMRKLDAWCLVGPSGWFLAEWPSPIVGRYILIFNRPSGGDNWRSAKLEVNGHEVVKIGAASTGTVIIADLGEPIAIKTIRITIAGVFNPGITGVEIHKSEKRG